MRYAINTYWRSCGLVNVLTRSLVLASLTAALSFEIWVAWHDFPPFALLTIGGILVAAAAGRFAPLRAPGIVAACGYAVPVVFVLTIGYHAVAFRAFWPLLLLAVIAPTMRRQWSIPAPLLYPLVAWAVGVALTWPIVSLREYDWMPWLLLHRPAEPSNAIHGLPAAVRIAQAAELDLLGIVWLDWLYSRFGARASREFERSIVLPMLVGALLASTVTLYQGFVDLSFGAVGDFWPRLGRAAGPLLDANATGALTALGIALPLAAAFSVGNRRAKVLLTLGAMTLLTAVWMTGSRTALFIAAVSLLSLVPLALNRRSLRRPLAAVLVCAIVIVAALRIAGPSTIIGPFERNRELFDTLSRDGVKATADALWQRQGYGTAAVALIRMFPWQGVGIGAFGGVATEYSRIVPDNAQNWFRHELAELGILGCLGLLAWTGLVVYALCRPVADADKWTVIPLKFTIVAFTLASMLGVPGQNLFVALTVWTLLFWLVQMTWRDTKSVPNSRLLACATVVAVVFAGATLYAGLTELRQPFRAKRFAYPYRYGFRASLGPGGETRSADHAVVVQQAEGGRVRLEMWVEHPDADSHPVLVKLWLNGREIVAGRFGRQTPLVRVEPVAAGKFLVLETKVDRTFPTGDPTNPEGGLTLRVSYLP